MTRNWKETTWGSLAKLEYGKSLRDYRDSNGSYRVYGTNGPIGWNDKALCEFPSVIIGRKGAYRGIHYSFEPFFVIDTAFYLKPLIEFDVKWAYYQLLTQDINGMDSGSAIPSTSRDAFYNLNVSLPPLAEQRAIAGILSSLDDKIELLRRENQTLEAIAQTLFKEWFVKKEEKNWRSVKICDYAKTNIASIDSKYCYDVIQYLDTGSITEGEIEGCQTLCLQDAPSRARRLVKHNDILISTVRPDQKHYGIVKYPAKNLVVSTGFCVVSCDKIDPHFIYLLLTTDVMTEYLHLVAEGTTSTYPSIKPSDIENIEFKLPPPELLRAFSENANGFWDKIYNNNSQIQSLSKLRDALLPKLMRGEIRVSDGEIG